MPKKEYEAKMLGGFLLQSGEALLTEEDLHSRMLCKLLAYLLCHHSKPVTLDSLLAALWPSDDSENPVGALKNLVYRLRCVLKSKFANADCLVTLNGSYCWNPDLPVSTDMEAFERLLRPVEGETQPQQVQRLQGAVMLYKGPLLPLLAGEQWVIPLAAYYQSAYTGAMRCLLRLLDAQARWEELCKAARVALQGDSLEEPFHFAFIKALAQLGERQLALDHYAGATRQMYDKLGVEPAPEMQRLLAQLRQQQNKQELDLKKIRADLLAMDSGATAFLCRYDIFKQIYLLQVRRLQRVQQPTRLVLFTVLVTREIPQGSELAAKLQKTAMQRLCNVLLHGLRVGDAVAQYSLSQYIVMLPSCGDDAAALVAERILQQYKQQRPPLRASVQYSAVSIEAPAR